RLDHQVRRLTGHEIWAETDRQRRQASLNLGPVALAHARIDERIRSACADERKEIADHDGHRGPVGEGFRQAGEVVDADCPHVCHPSKIASANAIPRRVVAGWGSSWMMTSHPAVNRRCATADPMSPTPRTRTHTATSYRQRESW